MCSDGYWYGDGGTGIVNAMVKVAVTGAWSVDVAGSVTDPIYCSSSP